MRSAFPFFKNAASRSEKLCSCDTVIRPSYCVIGRKEKSKNRMILCLRKQERLPPFFCEIAFQVLKPAPD